MVRNTHLEKKSEWHFVLKQKVKNHLKWCTKSLKKAIHTAICTVAGRLKIRSNDIIKNG